MTEPQKPQDQKNHSISNLAGIKDHIACDKGIKESKANQSGMPCSRERPIHDTHKKIIHGLLHILVV